MKTKANAKNLYLTQIHITDFQSGEMCALTSDFQIFNYSFNERYGHIKKYQKRESKLLVNFCDIQIDPSAYKIYGLSLDGDEILISE